MTMMHAIGFDRHLPIEDNHSFFDVTVPRPEPTGHDLLVQIIATSVNPVDTAVRRNTVGILEHPKVIGWDAYGIVTAVGNDVHDFQSGDRVFYAGSFKRSGTDSDYQLVDERIVGHAQCR